MKACIEDINICNMLKLNKHKTELIVFSSKQHVMKTENLSIKLEPNLGFILDKPLGMDKQVNSVSNSCYYQIRNI